MGSRADGRRHEGSPNIHNASRGATKLAARLALSAAARRADRRGLDISPGTSPGNWNRWTGAARFETTDDAYIVGDVTPLAAKVSGYVKTVAVGDYQAVRKGDLIVEIDPSDYAAALEQAEASRAAAQASLENLANQKDVQRALIRQAEATIVATEADLTRYQLELKRQQDLLADPDRRDCRSLSSRRRTNEKRTEAQLLLNKAQLDQQKALLASLDVQEKQLQAQLAAAKAAVDLARNNLNYTRIVSPADGLVGQRQVRPGQFINAGTQVIAVVPLPNLWVIANYKETQMTNVRIGEPATGHRRRLSRPEADRPCRQLGAGHGQHIRAAAAG